MILSQNRDAAAVRVPPPLLYLLSIVVGALLHLNVRPWPLPGLPEPTADAVGFGLIFAGIAVAVSALVHFKRTGQNPEPWKPTPSIVAEGIYRYSRNPMYVGMAIVQIGVGTVLVNMWVIALTALSLVAVFFVAVRHEEAYLERKFGDDYRHYKARVRRWL